MTKVLLKLEEVVLLVLVLYLYYLLPGNWLKFLLLIFIPDISMVGYLKSKKLGAFTYNLIHNFVLAFLLICIGSFLNTKLFLEFGIILTAHVLIDRLLGFGLKYTTGFKDTHLGKIGK